MSGMRAETSDRRAAMPADLDIGDLHLSQKLHLRFERDAEMLAHAPAALGHQRDDVRGRCATPLVLDEVRMFRREARRPDLEAAATCRFEQFSGGAPACFRVVRVLEGR